MAKSRTQRFYDLNPASRRVKARYQAKFNKREDQAKKRAELNAFNRKQTKLGNNKVGDGTDASHKGNRIVGYSKQSRNRGDSNNSTGDSRARSKRRKR